jgi:hypothetical protein
VAGKPVSGTPGTSSLTGPRTKSVVPLTQQDAIHGTTEPGNFIADVGNRFNDDIRKITGGGWLESVPKLDQNGQPDMDGEGNPIYNIVTHEPGEVPPPGLTRIAGALEYTDSNTLVDRGPNQGKPTVHRPDQWVKAVPASVLTQDAGGTIIEGDTVGRAGGAKGSQPGAPEQQVPSAGYSTIHAVGPDGATRVMYRTGNGDNIPYLYHTEPPVVLPPAGTPGGARLATDPKTGIKTPVLTAHPVETPGKTSSDPPTVTMVYDTTPLTTGFTNFRKQLPSGNFVLGTYRTQGATATALSINAIFAKNGTGAVSPQSMADATKFLNKYKAGVEALPLNDPERVQASLDLPQLTQWTQMHAGGKVGQTYADDYTTLNDRNPQQMNYEKQLRAGGFNTAADPIETSRRVGLYQEIDKAERRLLGEQGVAGSDRASLFEEGGPYSMDPAKRMRQAGLSGDLAALAQAKKDILNPTISVSSIKIPGVEPMMQGMSPEELARQAGIAAGASMVGGAAPKFPTGTVIPAPASSPTYYGPPAVTADERPRGPTAPTPPKPAPPAPTPVPKTPGLVAPPTPTAGALTPEQERRREEERRNGHGNLEF